MYGMGTYICAVPVYSQIPDRGFMLRNRLNIEHHAAPDLFVSFIYNLSGGALVKWFKRTFVCSHYDTIPLPDVNYDSLFGEVPETISNIIVIPRFGPTGPPEFLKANAGTIAGLSLEHNRGDILKAILEGITFYFKDFFEHPDTDTFGIRKFIANGGGSRSKIWLQITADILNKPIVRNKITEAGALGAAILAGTGSGIFSSPVEGTQQMVKKDTEILPNPVKVEKYNEKFEHYKRLYSYRR
jgi:xylulokinase